MPLTRMKDDYAMSAGVKFWMADEGRPVLCRVTHEALRDHADRVRLNVADDKVFEAYRELIEQVASDAYDAGANVDDAGCALVSQRLSVEDELAARHRAAPEGYERVHLEDTLQWRDCRS